MQIDIFYNSKTPTKGVDFFGPRKPAAFLPLQRPPADSRNGTTTWVRWRLCFDPFTADAGDVRRTVRGANVF